MSRVVYMNKGADEEATFSDHDELKLIQQFLVSNRDKVGHIKLGKKIGSGTFGVVFDAWMQDDEDEDEDVKVAVKFQFLDSSNNRSYLESERDIYTVLNKPLNSQVKDSFYSGVPRCYNYVSDHKKLCMLIMPFYGSDLSKQLASMPRQKFSEQTAGLIAIQMIDHLEYIHKRGIVHRDIKPGNMVIGGLSGMNRTSVHLVDFGLSKPYIDPATRKHIERTKNKGIVGTLRYIGLHANFGAGPSRRDDLQALAYVLIYFVRGDLPWSNIIRWAKRGNDIERNKEVGKAKKEMPREKLCKRMAPEFGLFLKLTHELGFDQEPDYAGLRKLWTDMLCREYNGVILTNVDWILRHSDNELV